MSNTSDNISFLVINEETIPPDLEHQIKTFLVTCFPHEPLFLQQSWWHSKPVYRIIALSNDQFIAGHTAIVTKRITVGKATLPVSIAGVQSFSVIPQWRGKGISNRLMKLALDTAQENDVEFGMLFCNPAVDKVYRGMGWQTVNNDVLMLTEEHKEVLRDGTTMIYPFIESRFPSGPIQLHGRDW